MTRNGICSMISWSHFNDNTDIVSCQKGPWKTRLLGFGYVGSEQIITKCDKIKRNFWTNLGSCGIRRIMTGICSMISWSHLNVDTDIVVSCQAGTRKTRLVLGRGFVSSERCKPIISSYKIERNCWTNSLSSGKLITYTAQQPASP
jgi:hypothetical protein